LFSTAYYCDSQTDRQTDRQTPLGLYSVTIARIYVLIAIHRESKKGATLTMAITLSVLGEFANFFHCCKEH